MRTLWRPRLSASEPGPDSWLPRNKMHPLREPVLRNMLGFQEERMTLE